MSDLSSSSAAVAVAGSAASPATPKAGPKKMRVITKKKVTAKLPKWKLGPEKVQKINEAITEIMNHQSTEAYKKSLKGAFKEEFGELFVNYLESMRLASCLSLGKDDVVQPKLSVSQNKIIQSRNIFSIFYLFLKEKDIYSEEYQHILVKKFLQEPEEDSDMASEVLVQ